MVCKLIKKVAAKVAGKKTPKIEEKTMTLKSETTCAKKACCKKTAKEVAVPVKTCTKKACAKKAEPVKTCAKKVCAKKTATAEKTPAKKNCS